MKKELLNEMIKSRTFKFEASKMRYKILFSFTKMREQVRIYEMKKYIKELWITKEDIEIYK